MNAADTKRFNDLDSWISSGHRSGRPLSEEEYERLEAERDALIQRHGPEFARHARARSTGEAYRRPAGARPRAQSEHTARRRSSSPNPTRRDSSPGGRPAPRPRASQSARGRAGAAATQTVRYVDRGSSIVTGDTASSWGGLVVDIFLGGVLLSVGYLLLTHAQGPSRLFSGASKLVANVVSPHVDPLNPNLKLGAA